MSRHPLHPTVLLRGARLLRNFVGGGLSHANVQITNRCNMRCGFCTFPSRAVPPREELTLEEWRAVSRNLAREGSVVVSLEGGEPLLREDAPEIVEAFAEHHHPWLYTNGWFVTDDLARRLFAAGALSIGVSIDYAQKERHDRSRGLDGAFERATAAVERLASAAPRGPGQVHVLSILLDDNVAELEPLLELSRRLGVRHMFTMLSTEGIYRSDKAQQMPRRPLADQILGLKKRHPHLAVFRSYVRDLDRWLAGDPPPCGAGIHGMNLDHQGNASPCIELAHRVAANVAREPWADVKRKLAAIDEPRSCQKCFTLCRGATDTMARASLGDWRDFFVEFVG